MHAVTEGLLIAFSMSTSICRLSCSSVEVQNAINQNDMLAGVPVDDTGVRDAGALRLPRRISDQPLWPHAH